LQSGQDVIKDQEYIHSYEIAEESPRQEIEELKARRRCIQVSRGHTILSMRSQRNLHNKHLKSFRLAKMSPKVRRGQAILSMKLQRNHHNRNLKRTDILSMTHHLLASTSVAYCSPLQNFTGTALQCAVSSVVSFDFSVQRFHTRGSDAYQCCRTFQSRRKQHDAQNTETSNAPNVLILATALH
jgi:hypothetical protein